MPRTYEYSATVKCPCCGERVDAEIDANVTGRYRGATRLDPAEYPDVDIVAVRIAATGKDITDQIDTDSLKEDVEEQAGENEAAAREDAAERRAEERRDARRMGDY